MSTFLNDRSSIEQMVNLFYEKVRHDDLLAPIFQQVDWQKHLPVMYDFWCSMVLGERTYQGSPFDKHMTLHLKAIHFEQWLVLFNATLDENFSGENLSELKQRVYQIASVWQVKLGISGAPG